MGSTTLASTYDFRSRDVAGNPTLPALIVTGNGYIRIDNTDYASTDSTKVINILGLTEMPGTGYVDVRTNGWIGTARNPFAEYTDDLQVGRIISTQSNVFLSAPKAIVDQLNDGYVNVTQTATVTIARSGSTGTITRSTGSWTSAGFAVGQRIYVDGFLVGTVSTLTSTVITLTALTPELVAGTGSHTITADDGTDVTGVNITMTAGTGHVNGGIGKRANFLETNVDVLNGTGVLNAWDRLAPTPASS